MITDINLVTKEGHVYAQINCRWCPVQVDVPIHQDRFDSWMAGHMIQDAMPELSPDLRELFITGTCPTCWEEMYNMNDNSGWTTYVVTTAPNGQTMQVHVNSDHVIVAAGTSDKSCFRPDFIGADWAPIRERFEKRGWTIEEME